MIPIEELTPSPYGKSYKLANFKQSSMIGGKVFYFDVDTEKWISVRECAEYKYRRKFLRDCWIVVALFMMLVPAAYAIIVAFMAIFLSLMFLDEVAYDLGKND